MNGGHRPQWAECYERARLACEKNDLQAVEAALKEGLSYASRDSAPEMDCGQMRFSLGWCFHAQGRLPEAEREYLQAKEIFTRCSGAQSPKVADVLHNLGSLYCDMDRTAEAEPLLLKALELKKVTRGENHPDVAELKSLLAGLPSVPVPERTPPPEPSAATPPRRRLPRGVVPTQDDLDVQSVAASVDKSQRMSAAKKASSEPKLVGDNYVLFPVSLLKMTVMTWVTMGWYLIAWQYMNWLCLNKIKGKKEPEGITVLNVVLFSCFLIFPLCRRMRSTGQTMGFNEPLAAVPLATAYILLSILLVAVDHMFHLPINLGAFGFLPLLVVQRYANALNAFAIPDCEKNNKFSGLNWVAIVIGGGLHALAIAGFFMK